MELSRETITHNGRQYLVRYLDDDDHDHPWQNDDGRGIVTDWISDSSDKKPGWRPLHSDRGSTRYFDWAGTIAKAKADGWGVSGDERHALAAVLGRDPTPGQITEHVVQREFEFLRAYCNDEWSYVGIEVIAFVDGELNDDLSDKCWGFETWKGGHRRDAQEMIENLEGRVVAAEAKAIADEIEAAEIETRNEGVREQARSLIPSGYCYVVYDDAEVDEVDDGYWVTAKIFVEKESENEDDNDDDDE